MIKVNEAEVRLINDLTKLLRESRRAIGDLVYGLDLAKSILDSKEAETKISPISNALKELDEIISHFSIGSDKDKSGNETENLWISWYATDASPKYCYRDNSEAAKPLTTKTLAFVLMSFEREICSRIAAIEGLNEIYIFRCTVLKDGLSKIIADYMTA